MPADGGPAVHTVQGRSSTPRDSVAGAGPRPAALCSLPRTTRATTRPTNWSAAAEQYFIDAENRLVRLTGTDTAAAAGAGPFGTGDGQVGSVAVPRDEQDGGRGQRRRPSL